MDISQGIDIGEMMDMQFSDNEKISSLSSSCPE
jgi:hypothetical protein